MSYCLNFLEILLIEQFSYTVQARVSKNAKFWSQAGMFLTAGCIFLLYAFLSNRAFYIGCDFSQKDWRSELKPGRFLKILG